MLRDLYDITNYKAKVVIRVFNIKNGIENATYEDIEITSENVDHYDKIFVGDCIVPMEDKLLIEGTI